MSLVTLEAMRAEGLSADQASDGAVLSAIALAEAYVGMVTGRWFEPVEYPADAPFLMDGSGTDTLLLPVPVLRLDYIDILSEGPERILPANVINYNRLRPDDRLAARLVRKMSELPAASTVFGFWTQRTTCSIKWPHEPLGIAIVGQLGFVEADGSPPPAIVKTVKRMVMREVQQVAFEDVSLARVTSESTDGHSYSLAGAISSSGLTGDPVIDSILATYKFRGGGTTASWGR